MSPNDSAKIVAIRSASSPLTAASMSGIARMKASMRSSAVAPPMMIVSYIARGIRRPASETSSATSPHASKP